MTLLAALRAADGLAAISDRKETVPLGSPRNVKKFHVDKPKTFYISPAGDGPLADGVLMRLARARAGPADVVARVRDIATALHSGRAGEALQAGGFLIIAGRAGLKLYSICISGRHVDVLEDRNGASVRGDGPARALCQYIAKEAGFSGMPCEEAARRPHVPAGDAAERAGSAGEMGACGLDLGLFAEDGGARLMERRTERLGRIDMRFRTNAEAGQPAARGGGEA